ncbi:hypothetical protein BOTBODRAFT_208361 [Botryobasidium botryosum FD-172 SS1]|uniref:AAA+ ATPase domain-containing protein n=1 Tax=Botryobasidium botryosum (strain FD-172 SS1) TaxID=930990 RepID=A0A067NBU7_BOTB1|nr:hypothetical protein BOTBODRAFT_208361 [Botryobasidium botryosum FD-172 SS1]
MNISRSSQATLTAALRTRHISYRTHRTRASETAARGPDTLRHNHGSLEREGEHADGGPGPDSSGGWGLELGSPRQLAQYLDTFVVGQERAKKVLSVAVFNHYNRIRAKLHAAAESQAEWSDPDVALRPHPFRRHHQTPPHLLANSPPLPLVEKSNVLLIGPTGSGKTLLARTLAKVLNVPFAMSDATALTQAGYVGEDVEMCIQRLLQASAWDVQRAGIGIVCIDEADKLARRSSAASDSTKDVSGEGVQQGLLRMLEGSVVNVQSKGFDGPGSGNNGPPGAFPSDIVPPGSGSGLNLGPGRRGANPPSSAPKSDTYQVDTTDILFILSGAFVGLDKVVHNRMSKGSIGFDAPLKTEKKEPSGVGFMPFFTPNGKQNQADVLDLVEPNDLIQYGFIPEFTSRLPTIAALKPLTTADLMRVLTEVRGALAKQYEALFGYSGVDIRFTTPALRVICEKAAARGMGARGLRGIMESLLLDPMYDVPGSSVRYVLIDASAARGERPALYWSRGQRSQFYSAIAAEEEKDMKERGEASAEP